MELNGTYSERIDFYNHSLSIEVSKPGVVFSVYVPGPDRRYNGEFYRLSISDINQLIASIRAAWDRYQELKKIELPGGVFESIGNHVYVSTREFSSGVTVFSHRYICLTTEESVNAITS